jgi:hypothetical protein
MEKLELGPKLGIDEISVVEFSEHVRNRSGDLSRVHFHEHTYSSLLWAISSSGDSIKDFRNITGDGCHPSMTGRTRHILEQHTIEDECRTQSTLLSHGIVDEASAVLFLDRVEPIIQGWKSQHQAITGRYEMELKAFFEEVRGNS